MEKRPKKLLDQAPTWACPACPACPEHSRNEHSRREHAEGLSRRAQPNGFATWSG